MLIQAQEPGGERICLDVNSKLINRNSSGQARKSFGIGLGSILRRQPIERAGKLSQSFRKLSKYRSTLKADIKVWAD